MPSAETFDDDVTPAPAVDWAEAQAQDAYWRRTCWQERYYRWDCDYEDYAPAYCVGYVGCVQYGGSFGDAERSLCANWERIKSDSRLTLDEAMPAIRAAWDRMARLRQRRERPAMNDASFAAPATRAGHVADAPVSVAA